MISFIKLETMKKSIYLFIASILMCALVKAQQSPLAAGGVATSTNGSISFSIGQLFDDAYGNNNDMIVCGLQQPYEFYNPLPLQLLDFIATPNLDNIKLGWHTSTELNTSRFIVQHSTDGTSFTDIGNVKAIGSGANGYSSTDNNPTPGINYYRLKSVDKDGSFAYSKIVSVQFTVNSNQLAVYPNPSKDKVTVRGNHIASIQVVDNMGKILKTQTLKDATNPTLSVGSLPVGVYHLRVQTNDGKVNGVGFVKE